MENQSFTFIAQTIEENLWFWGGLLLTIGAGAGSAGLLMKKGPKDRHLQRILGAMLLFFLALIAGGSALFSGITLGRLDKVVIHTEGITYRGTDHAWDQVKRVFVVQSKEKNALNLVTRNTGILVLELKGGKQYLFSERNYPVKEMLRRIYSFRPEEEE